MSSVKIAPRENSASNAACWLDLLGVRSDREGRQADKMDAGEGQEGTPEMLDAEIDDASFLSCLSLGGDAGALETACTTGSVGASDSDTTRIALGAQDPKPAPITTSMDRAVADTTGAAQAVFSQMQASVHNISGGLNQAAQGPALAVRGIAVSAKV